jgi:hypothetical protein
VIWLVNDPMPVPFVDLVASSMVGFAVVLQQMPLTVTGSPPSEVIFPPLKAVVNVTSDKGVEVRVGIVIVLNCISDPYPVPALLVA